MEQTSFYSEQELELLGLSSYGKNVRISRNAKLYSPQTITIGDDVRIDDFCLLSGIITLGSHIHISAYSALYGGGEIIMEDYTGLSPRCTLISATDDFSGDVLIGPCVEESLRNVEKAKIVIQKYSQVGTQCTILPGVVLEEGTAVGAMSLVNKSLPCWSICYGIPAKKQKERSRNLLNLVYDS